MHRPTSLNTGTLPVPNLINRWPMRCGFLLVPLTLTCFAFSPAGRAVDPPPDGGYSSVVTGTPSLMGAIPLFFKDLHINGGAPTRGSLEVTVRGGRFSFSEIQLDSFTYNSPGQASRLATIPDQGSSLALLAMSAGGVLALRRLRTTQGSS